MSNQEKVFLIICASLIIFTLQYLNYLYFAILNRKTFFLKSFISLKKYNINFLKGCRNRLRLNPKNLSGNSERENNG